MEGTDPPTLPPQMFTTSAQLLDLTDSMVFLELVAGGREGGGDGMKHVTYATHAGFSREIDDHSAGWKEDDWGFEGVGSGTLPFPSPFFHRQLCEWRRGRLMFRFIDRQYG